jgi:hypothetical protein
MGKVLHLRSVEAAFLDRRTRARTDLAPPKMPRHSLPTHTIRVRTLARTFRWNWQLEPFEQLRNVHFEGSCDGIKRIDAGRYGPILDLREVSPPDLRHIRQMRLR